VPRIARRIGRAIDGIAPAFIERALAYDWPGNVRELKNVIERALIMSRGGPLDDRSLAASPPVEQTGVPGSLEELERAHIRQVLEDSGWQIEGDSGAATEPEHVARAHAQAGNPSRELSRTKRLAVQCGGARRIWRRRRPTYSLTR
jgi:DNA-binding NtrC family response regulator